MSPTCKARFEKAQRIFGLFYGADANSPTARAEYQKINELLAANKDDEQVALIKFKEWRGE